MSQPLPHLADLSHAEKDDLILRLFEELNALREEVKTLRDEVKILRDENKELRGKLAKNSQNNSKPPSSDGYQKPKPKSLQKTERAAICGSDRCASSASGRSLAVGTGND